MKDPDPDPEPDPNPNSYQEVQDEYAAHLGVTQPGQGNPDPSPVLILMDYVGDTWAGLSKHEYLKQ